MAFLRGGRSLGTLSDGVASDAGWGRTVFGVLSDNLHGADDAGCLAVGVVEEGLVAGVHGSEMVPCCSH